MRRGILRASWLRGRLRERRPESAEPRFSSRAAAQLPVDSLAANGDLSIAPGETERQPQASAPSADRARAAPMTAGIPVGMLLYLGVVGFVAAIVSGSFGAGFFALAVPANRSIAVSEGSPAPPQAHAATRAAVSLEAGIPPAPAPAAAAPELPQPADAARIPPPHSNTAAAPTSPPSAAEATIVPAVSRVAISSAPPDDSASGSDAPAAGQVAPTHPRVAASPVRHGASRPPTAQAERTRLSGRAATRVHGRTRHFNGTLTPPAAGSGDPLARQAAGR
jgi:hypothetical protein